MLMAIGGAAAGPVRHEEKRMPVNPLIIVVAAVAYFVLGALWYSKPLFGNQWGAMMNITPEGGAMPPWNMALTFASALLAAYMIAWFNVARGGVGVAGAATTALMAWLGFALTVALTTFVWEKKPWALFGINMGYHLVGFLVAAAIIGQFG
jgi:hypothetical protein